MEMKLTNINNPVTVNSPIICHFSMYVILIPTEQKKFDSFKLSFELLFKEDDANYTLKEYYCDSNKNCVLNSTENNAEINQIYFKRVVNQDLYNNTFKKEISKNNIFSAKLTSNGEVFQKYLVDPKYCQITHSKK